MEDLINTRAYYESKIEELVVKKPKLSIKDIKDLSREITEAIDSYIIDDYGINPILHFNDEEGEAYDIIFNKINDKYG